LSFRETAVLPTAVSLFSGGASGVLFCRAIFNKGVLNQCLPKSFFLHLKK
jgi:hypothetical protein